VTSDRVHELKESDGDRALFSKETQRTMFDSDLMLCQCKKPFFENMQSIIKHFM
jgi:hypothetical protein